MGAKSVAELIKPLPNISNLTYVYDSELKFEYLSNASPFPKRYNVYMPTRDDYEVTIDIVDKAIQSGANLIVYDLWIKSTYSAKTYGEKKGITIYTFGNFLRKIKNGEPL